MKSRLMVLRSLIPMIGLLSSGVLAYGQSTTWARLVGTVTDQSGRRWSPGSRSPRSTKRLTSASKTLTNDRGDYIIDNLRPGIYDVSSELPGFKKQVVRRRCGWRPASTGASTSCSRPARSPRP